MSEVKALIGCTIASVKRDEMFPKLLSFYDKDGNKLFSVYDSEIFDQYDNHFNTDDVK